MLAVAHSTQAFAGTGHAGSNEHAPSQFELARIVSNHWRYLARQGGVRADLRSTKLDGRRLAGWDLSEADLSGASLVGTKLNGANLSGASLYCADLRDCDLRSARLDHADLRGASFKGANLSHAVMDYADLRAATMLHLGDRPRLQGNAHKEAPFGAVDFSNCSLRHASFQNAKLDNADFTDAQLHEASFRGARLKSACFRGAILSGVDLAELNLPARAFQDCITSPSPAVEERANTLFAALIAHHEWFVSGGKRGWPADVVGADLRPLAEALKGLCLAGLNARNVIADSVDFSDCGLQAAKFDGADLRGAHFDNADLSGASFQGTKLAHASFRNARLDEFKLCTGQVLPFRASRPRYSAATASFAAGANSLSG